MQEEKLNNSLRRYFDWKFENTYFTREKGNNGFYGFFNNNDEDFLVTKDEDIWYYDGATFLGGYELFDMVPSKFARMMKQYVLEKYPEYNLIINSLW